MKQWWFKQTYNLLPGIYKDGYLEYMDCWQNFYKAVEESNKNRKIKVPDSAWKEFDKTMSAWRPQKI